MIVELDAQSSIIDDNFIQLYINCHQPIIRVDNYRYSIDKLYDLSNVWVLVIERYDNDIYSLPRNLRKIVLGDFRRKIKHYPETLNEMILDNGFNIYVEHWPKNLRRLTTVYNFNQSLDNLPFGLEYLKIGGLYNQSLNNLPKSLKKLEFNGKYENKFNQVLDNLPDELETLMIIFGYDKTLDFLPIGLVNLHLGHYVGKLDNLPMNLKRLSFPFMSKFRGSIDNLPDSIEMLELPLDYDLLIKRLPRNLVKFRASLKFVRDNQEVIDRYPNIEMLMYN